MKKVGGVRCRFFSGASVTVLVSGPFLLLSSISSIWPFSNFGMRYIRHLSSGDLGRDHGIFILKEEVPVEVDVAEFLDVEVDVLLDV